MAGSSFEQMQTYSAQARNDFPSKAAFYSAQKKIGAVVKQYAHESMQNARNQMEDGAMISADGRYPNRRNASHCSVDFIDNKTKKIVALGMADKKSVYHRDGVTLSSNMLESMCFERAVSQMDNLDKVSLLQK